MDGFRNVVLHSKCETIIHLWMTTIFLVSGGSQGHEMMQSKWQNNLIGRSEEKTGSFVALCRGLYFDLETKWIPR